MNLIENGVQLSAIGSGSAVSVNRPISSLVLCGFPNRFYGNLYETFPAPFHVMGVVLQ